MDAAEVERRLGHVEQRVLVFARPLAEQRHHLADHAVHGFQRAVTIGRVRRMPALSEDVDALHHDALVQAYRTQAGGLADHRGAPERPAGFRSEEHTSELQSLMRISYAVFCLKKKI